MNLESLGTGVTWSGYTHWFSYNLWSQSLFLLLVVGQALSFLEKGKTRGRDLERKIIALVY